jgi:hypothetical protein
MLEQLDETLATATTRRTIVKTGAKLAYAAPLVALSFQVSQRGAGATGAAASPTQPPTECGHSFGGASGGGCMAACTSTGCTGEVCDGCNAPGQPCDPCCTEPGGGNVCPSADYCDPGCFTCTNGVAAFVC